MRLQIRASAVAVVGLGGLRIDGFKVERIQRPIPEVPVACPIVVAVYAPISAIAPPVVMYHGHLTIGPIRHFGNRMMRVWVKDKDRPERQKIG